jgi:hypothetical protein
MSINYRAVKEFILKSIPKSLSAAVKKTRFYFRARFFLAYPVHWNTPNCGINIVIQEYVKLFFNKVQNLTLFPTKKSFYLGVANM